MFHPAKREPHSHFMAQTRRVRQKRREREPTTGGAGPVARDGMGKSVDGPSADGHISVVYLHHTNVVLFFSSRQTFYFHDQNVIYSIFRKTFSHFLCRPCDILREQCALDDLSTFSTAVKRRQTLLVD